MTTFDDREKAFEQKFAHDAEIMFKVRARRNRLFGEWVAGELGIAGDEASDYASSIISADLEEEGDDDVFRKVKADYEARSVVYSDTDVRAKLKEFMAAAQDEVMSE
jgi:hypothetical protein